jgi:transcriptional regulator with XRE-family HTH domain
MKTEIGKRIKELRVRKGMTQEELAGRTELSTRTIQRIENGEVDPRAYSLQMIAKALDVDYSLFVEDKPTEDEEKNDQRILGYVHLSGLLPLFIPTVLVWKKNKNKVKGITGHFYEVIGFQLTVWLIIVLPGMAMHYFLSTSNFTNNGLYYILIGLVIGALASIHNAIRVMNDEPFQHFNILKFKKS